MQLKPRQELRNPQLCQKRSIDHVKIKGREDHAAIHHHLAIQAHEARFWSVNSEAKSRATPRLFTQDLTALGMEVQDRATVVIKADEMGECIHHRLQPLHRAAIGFSNGDLQVANLPRPDRQVVLASQLELKVQAASRGGESIRLVGNRAAITLARQIGKNIFL